MTRTREMRSEWSVSRDEAIPRLVDESGARLFSLARRICRTPEEAEDLVQETFLQAFRKWDQFEGRSDPNTWLYSIASRICMRLHRRRAGEPVRLESLEELLPFVETQMVVTTEDPFDEELRAEHQDLVGQALGRLPAHFRMAIVMKDIVGLSVAQTAEVMGIKEATVKTRVHRARLKLRRVLVATLPKTDGPPPAYSKEVCLDLLQAKQNALDQGIELPNASEIICERCQAVFFSLDLTSDVCRRIGEGDLPPELREALAARFEEERVAAKDR